MGASVKSLGIDRLSVAERLTLVEDIWDTIAIDSNALALTVTQRAELDRRLAEHESSPEDVVPWEVVRYAQRQAVGLTRAFGGHGTTNAGNTASSSPPTRQCTDRPRICHSP